MPPTLADVQPLPTVDVPGVELCWVGNWNGRDYSAADLADAAQNWIELKGTFDVPLALGHDDTEHQPAPMGDGAPAIGWLDNVYFKGETLYGDYVKVPYKLAQIMKSGGLAKRSCEFYANVMIGGKQRKLVLWRVSLLGAQQPAVEGLADVASLYNRRTLARPTAPLLTLTSQGGTPMPTAAQLARLPEAASLAYYGWKARHPTKYSLISGPPMSDIQSAVEKALAAAYPPAQADDSEAPGADGPSQNVLDWFVSGTEMSAIVSDQDVDNLFEIPFTYDAGQDTATLGNPVPVKGTYTANTTGGESGGAGDDDAAPGDADDAAPPAADAAPPAADGGDGEAEALRRLAAAVADSAVEELVTEANGDFEKLLAKINSIAAGKPGVTEFRAMLDAAQKALGRIKVSKPPAADGGSPPTPKAAPAQNARQEEPDVKLSQLAKIYGLPETATEAEVLRAAEGAAASRNVVTTLARKVDALIERDAEKDTDAMLAQAVSEGRLKRFAKPGEDSVMYTSLRTLARKDFETAKQIVASLPPFVDTGEYGHNGNQGQPPSANITPGVARELRALGRDPDTISAEPLAERWKRERNAKITARAQKLGVPPPVLSR